VQDVTWPLHDKKSCLVLDCCDWDKTVKITVSPDVLLGIVTGLLSGVTRVICWADTRPAPNAASRIIVGAATQWANRDVLMGSDSGC
jgi:hypothetical protein